MRHFAKLRNETPFPFRKLYYEILNRFHPYDYDLALSEMSEDLREIIESCTKSIQNDSSDEQSEDQGVL